MSNKKKTFEENLQDLEEIVNQLETGEIPLEEAITQFQKGMALSKDLQKTLESAETVSYTHLTLPTKRIV